MSVRGSLIRYSLPSAIFALLAVFPSVAIGEPDTAFQQWWTRLTAGGGTGPDIRNVSFWWRSEFLYVPDASELARMRANVEGHPDHPDSRLLAVYDARLRGEQDWSDRRVWRNGPNAWRFNSTRAGPEPTEFDDAASDGGVGWFMSRTGLTIFDPTTKGEPTLHLSDTARLELASLLSLHLNIALADDVPLSPELVGKTRWKVLGDTTRARDHSTEHFEAEGDWDDSAGWGTISRSLLKTVSADGKQVAGYECDSQGWRYVPELGLGIAGQVTEKRLSGALDKRWTLQGFEVFDKAAFAALVKLPSPTAVDPVRGPVTFTYINDRRPGQPIASTVKDGVISPLTAATPVSQPGERILRTAGWVCLGAVVSALALLRLHRAKVRSRAG